MSTQLIIILSFLTTTMKHPMSMGSMLMLQTILVSNKMFKESESSWFSYILFITIIGGMMVMFMYMASIASNEKFKMSTKHMILTLFIMTTIIILYKEISLENLNKIYEEKFSTSNKPELKYTSKFFNKNKMNLTIMMMMFLLITMIITTNISSTFEGPLKKTYV
uniref:NADH dehydrogenase subunit 6 n=1 Tax=Ricania simulans TaxID=130630 RepID=UPI001EDD0924|nr:NADH dehydrogenase subunit 6 [Ricania simulans]UJT96885.1 NADH dehydrogenase subunit 6 [Ricania simulans]